MTCKTDKKKRQSVFSPYFKDMSSEAFWKIKKTFEADYPESGEMKEAIFCLFFSLLIDGVLPSSSPIKHFYALRLDDIKFKGDTIRVPKKNYSAGVMIYLSALSEIYLLHYLRLRNTETVDRKNNDSNRTLIIPEIMHKRNFSKELKHWLRRLAEKASLGTSLSILDLARMRELSLVHIYPAFITASLLQKISASHFSEAPMIRQNRKTQFGNSNISSSLAEQVEADSRFENIFKRHNRLSDLSGRLNQFTLKQERRLIMNALDEDLTYYPNPQTADEFNLTILASWFHNMLSSNISPNTIKTYFMQNSYLLRTELLGQFLDGFATADVENILENCSYSKTVVLKSALKSFLNFAKKNFGITMPDIAWRSLTKPKRINDTFILWPSDIKIILSNLSEELRVVVILGAFCGMRIGEIAGLALNDIAIGGESVLHIRRAKTKSGRRWLPLKLLLPPEIHACLQEYYLRRLEEAYFDNSKPLLINHNGQAFTNPQLLSNAVQKIFDKLEYGWATFHTLRHSFASVLLLRWYRTIDSTHIFRVGDKTIHLDDFGIENDRTLLSYGLPDIARMLGHADIRTTVKNYIHTLPLLQKAYLNRHEMDFPIMLSKSQIMILTGLSKPGFYKQFSLALQASTGVRAEKVADYLMKKFKP